MNKFLNKIQNQKGLTLIEVLIYIGIFSLMISIIVQVMSGTFYIFAQARSVRDLNNTGSSIMETISTNVRNAYDFNSTNNTFGANPGSLSILIRDAADASHTYTYTPVASNTILSEQIDLGTVNNLHSSKITLTNFTVSQITTGGTQGAVITIELTDNRIVPAKSATFQTTVLMRGTY